MQRRSTTPTWRRPCLYYTCARGGAAPRPVPLSRGHGEDATMSNRQPPRSASWWWTHSPMLSLVDSTRGHGRGPGVPRQRMPWDLGARRWGSSWSWRAGSQLTMLKVHDTVPLGPGRRYRATAWPSAAAQGGTNCRAGRSNDDFGADAGPAGSLVDGQPAVPEGDRNPRNPTKRNVGNSDG